MRMPMIIVLTALLGVVFAGDGAAAGVLPRQATELTRTGSAGSTNDSSRTRGVRVVKWDAVKPLKLPFGKLTRAVVITAKHGSMTRRVYQSQMKLEWYYQSLVSKGTGSRWTYSPGKADVDELKTRFWGDEKAIMEAPWWLARAELIPAGGNGDLISLLVTFYESAGGAHGWSVQHLATISAVTGQPLRLSEILTAEASARIHSVIADSIKEGPLDETTSEAIETDFGVRLQQGALHLYITLP